MLSNKITMYKFLRKNFKIQCLSPMSIDLIEPNLYLGSRPNAEDMDTLKKYNLTHILTVEEIPLNEEVSKNQNFTTKMVSLEDDPTEKLLDHLEDTYAFISDGLSRGTVFIHCMYGMSRSAAVVIAFFMKRHQLTYEEAFHKVQQQRNQIQPNLGFVSQLRLYQKMGYKVDTTHADYKILRLQKLADYIGEIHTALQNHLDIIQDDPELNALEETSKAFCCKKCRRILARASDLIPHEHNGENCTKSYFVMPVTWMNVTKTTENKLYCPKCKSELGSFSWTDAIECPCDVKQTPAFRLAPSAVNFMAPLNDWNDFFN